MNIIQHSESAPRWRGENPCFSHFNITQTLAIASRGTTASAGASSVGMQPTNPTHSEETWSVLFNVWPNSRPSIMDESYFSVFVDLGLDFTRSWGPVTSHMRACVVPSEYVVFAQFFAHGLAASRCGRHRHPFTSKGTIRCGGDLAWIATRFTCNRKLRIGANRHLLTTSAAYFDASFKESVVNARKVWNVFVEYAIHLDNTRQIDVSAFIPARPAIQISLEDNNAWKAAHSCNLGTQLLIKSRV